MAEFGITPPSVGYLHRAKPMAGNVESIIQTVASDAMGTILGTLGLLTINTGVGTLKTTNLALRKGRGASGYERLDGLRPRDRLLDCRPTTYVR